MNQEGRIEGAGVGQRMGSGLAEGNGLSGGEVMVGVGGPPSIPPSGGGQKELGWGSGWVTD